MTESSMVVRQIDGRDIPALLRRNTNLLDLMKLPTFFASPEWFEALLQTEQDIRCFGLVAYRADALVALLPLQVEQNWCGGQDIRFLGFSFYPDPLALICAEVNRLEAIQAFKQHLSAHPWWDRMILDFVVDEEGLAWGATIRHQAVAPYLELPPTFDSLLNTFNGKKRYKLRNKIKVAEEAGLSFSVAISATQKAEYIEQLFRLHEQRSQRIGRNSSLKRRSVGELHKRLAVYSSCALLFALRKDDRVVAVTYGFLQHDRFFFFQITHDPEFDELRPGTVIVAKTMASVAELGAREFNFLQGDESYKFEWTQSVRNLVCVHWVAPTLRARLIDGAASAIERLKRALQTRDRSIQKSTTASPDGRN
jgi:CelD/BcsL family acetyltransferase involved in cellulose biosynthesis